MKISKLVKYLNKFKQDNGDLPVCMFYMPNYEHDLDVGEVNRIQVTTKYPDGSGGTVLFIEVNN